MRGELRALGVPLTPEIAPSVHVALASVRTELGVRDPIEIFQLPADEHQRWNAHFEGRRGDVVWLGLVGNILDVVDDGALRAILGHEIGHALAHAAPDAAGLEPRHQLARELTADRFGLLGEPDVMATIRAQLASASGSSSRSPRLDAGAYLRWCVSTVEYALARGGDFTGTTHPEHCVRVYAASRFAETDLFHELTGEGSGARAIGDVNAVVERIVDASTPRAPAPPPLHRPPSAPAPKAPARGPAPARIEAPGVTAATVLADLGSAAVGISLQLRKTAFDAAARYAKREPSVPAVRDEAPPADPVKADLLARFAELEKRMAKKDER